MTDPTMSEQVDLMEQAWSSLDEVLSDLTIDDWSRPTDCPGWTVKDQVSHMTGNECRMLGRERPAVDVPDYGWIKNDVGRSNEADVEARRSRSAEEVLAEWRDTTAERLRQIRAWEGPEWDSSDWAPPGQMKRRDALRFRIIDAWTHEQDIRRAIGKAGHLNGAVARFVFENYKLGAAMIVPKRAGAADHQSVYFDVSGMAADRFAVVVEDGRGKLDSTPPIDPTATLRMDLETFCCLCAGRWSAEAAIADGKVKMDGDEALGRRVLESMTLVP